MANFKITMIFNLIMGLAALYISWVALFVVYFKTSNFLHNYPNFTGMTNFFDLLTNPAVLWEYISELDTTGGLSIAGKGHSFRLHGAWFWVLIGIEAAVIAGSPLSFGYRLLSTSVFCDKCNAWADTTKEPALTFRHPYVINYMQNKTKECPDCAKSVKYEALTCNFCGEMFLNPFYDLINNQEFIHPIKEKFTNHCLAFLEDAEPAIGTAKWYFEVDVEWCKKCQELFAVSLRFVRCNALLAL